MRILEVVSGTGVNGAVVHALLLVEVLRARGHDVTVACRPGSVTEARLPAVGTVLSDLHRWPPDELRRMAAVVRERRIDVIHTHLSRAHFFGVLLRRLAGVPVVATAHSARLQPHWWWNDHVIAVSEATARFQRRVNLVPRGRLSVVHNFVPLPGPIAADARPRLRASLGVAPDELLLGRVGSLFREKGVVHLVRALSKIPKAKLLLVGDGEAEVALRAEAANRGVTERVIFAGPRSDVSEILAALDVFVLPSLVEAFPMAILEAMAAGLPVVATRVGGVSECVADGETGLLVPPGDPEALAHAIASLDPGRRRTFGDAGRRRVREHFTAERLVPRIEAIFESLLR